MHVCSLAAWHVHHHVTVSCSDSELPLEHQAEFSGLRLTTLPQVKEDLATGPTSVLDGRGVGS